MTWFLSHHYLKEMSVIPQLKEYFLNLRKYFSSLGDFTSLRLISVLNCKMWIIIDTESWMRKLLKRACWYLTYTIPQYMLAVISLLHRNWCKDSVACPLALVSDYENKVNWLLFEACGVTVWKRQLRGWHQAVKQKTDPDTRLVLSRRVCCVAGTGPAAIAAVFPPGSLRGAAGESTLCKAPGV